MTTTTPASLRRFTTIPILLDLLLKKQLVLLDPDMWEDRNDAYYIEQYKKTRDLKTVLALCFSRDDQTFHHWKVFSGSASGVCIEFNGRSLIKAARSQGIVCRPVKYKTTEEAPAAALHQLDWPFLKRIQYEAESEYRFLFEDAAAEMQSRQLPFDISWVNKITLSPWMPKPVAVSVATVIKGIDGCKNLRVVPSTLLENNRWKKAINPTLEGTD